MQELLPILDGAKKLFLSEPTLLEVEVPCVVIGDIHGQYEDLHRMFSVLGTGRKSGAVKRRFVFLGDYVDRGMSSLETICCLLAHKLMFPNMFNMLRGNHESPDINQTYGFQMELERKFPTNSEGLVLWNAFNDLFACLPLAALIHDRILCVHGGIGPELKCLNDIRKVKSVQIKRPISDPTESPLACSLLWSDPMLDLKGFIRNSIRGAGYFFGEDTVVACCEQLNIDLVVRAHQNNKCAIMQVEEDLRVGFILLCPVTPETQGTLIWYSTFLYEEFPIFKATITSIIFADWKLSPLLLCSLALCDKFVKKLLEIDTKCLPEWYHKDEKVLGNDHIAGVSGTKHLVNSYYNETLMSGCVNVDSETQAFFRNQAYCYEKVEYTICGCTVADRCNSPQAPFSMFTFVTTPFFEDCQFVPNNVKSTLGDSGCNSLQGNITLKEDNSQVELAQAKENGRSVNVIELTTENVDRSSVMFESTTPYPTISYSIKNIKAINERNGRNEINSEFIDEVVHSLLPSTDFQRFMKPGFNYSKFNEAEVNEKINIAYYGNGCNSQCGTPRITVLLIFSALTYFLQLRK
ncbi:unnamed protein product [Litomosoides sigmodontis]|uniref:Serine/threonine-protein phosphatase n=1 Tax=Litomosoides sigmodontis TaxID=42156 RepID=A0A3P6U4X4_LITSI|nr:unnamed protein product [Litomosoides sigmodontis]